MNSFLLFIAGLLVLALSALFAAPYFIDWNDYRDVFEAQATKLIGRNVDVGGDVSLTLLPAPVMRFETINVADAEGKFETPLAAAKSVTVWLSVPPLLRGTIEARSIEIVQPVVNMRIKEDGTGNWADLGGESASLPFIPNDVALNSVEISDATINVWRGNTEPDITLDTVDGELSSRGLQGPYKFNGQFTMAGEQRELRLSTGKPDDDGEFKLNVSLRSPKSRDSYVINGAVRGLGRIPVMKGELTARLADGTAPSGEDKAANAAPGTAPYEIKSDLFAGLTGAQFDNFEMTINKNNKPQTIKGLIDLKFEKGVVLGGTFSSRSLDVDSLLKKEGGESLGLRGSIDAVSGEIQSRLASVREGSMRFFLDQATLAGDLATKVQAELIVADDKIEISRFTARLPGDNRISLNGNLSRNESGSSFKGPVSVDGKALSRLLRWAGVETDASVVTQQGDFSLQGDVNIQPKKFQLNEASGNLFGSVFEGNLDYSSDTDSKLAVNLKSERLDLARLLGSKATAPALLSLWSDSGDHVSPSSDSESKVSLLGGVRTDADVKIGSVTLSGLGETAVDMKVSFDRSTLDIKRLSVVSGQDVAIQAGGRLAGLDGKPEGNITLSIQANSGKGVIGIGEFLELADISKSDSARVAALTPVQITAAIKSAGSAESGLGVQVEGSLGKSDLLMKLDLAGGPSLWREADVVMQASLANERGIDLLKQLRPGLSKSANDSFAGGAGRVSLEVEGVPKTGLKTRFALGAGGADVLTQGIYTFGDADNSYAGTASLSAKNTAAGLALLGVHVPEGHGTEAMEIAADVEMAGPARNFKNFKGTIGGASFDGDIKTDNSADRLRVTASVKASDASLPRLLAPIVSWSEQESVSRQIRGVTQPGAQWPEERFNSQFLNSFDGEFSLEAENLVVHGPLHLKSSQLKAKMSDGRLSVTSLEGETYGGRVQLRGMLQSRGSGAALEVSGEGSGFRLAELTKTRDDTSLIDAPGDVKFSVSGEGLTPQGLVSGLSGSGQLTILDGEINGFSLGAAHAAAVAAQKEKSDNGIAEEELGKRVAEQLASSSMAFTQIKAPFSVNNGVVEFDKVALSDAEGRVIVATYVQLANMQLDSEWALQSAEGIDGSKPRVSLVFTGPLRELGKLSPSIDTAGLARFVTIQKLQKDVERLEKLDVSGPTPEKKIPAPEKPLVPPVAPVAQANPATEPPAAPEAPPGPPPPLPERKKVDAPPKASAAAPASSQPPPVQPVIPGVSNEPAPQPQVTDTPPTAPVEAGQPVARATEPVRKPVEDKKEPSTPAVEPVPALSTASAADVPRKLAPLPVRKPPVPKPVPVVKRKPPQPATATRTAPASPNAGQSAPSAQTPAPANLPWLQTTNPPSNAQSAAQPQTPDTPSDQPQPTPPPRPAERFDPFANPTN